MQKILICLMVCSLVIAPSIVLASPGPVDQYGGHVCLKDCSLLGLETGQYHFHEIPLTPSYLTGSAKKTQSPYIYYLPNIDVKELTASAVSISGNAEDLNSLTKNPEIDARFCDGANIFAYGWYDSLNRARIKPVCYNNEDTVKTNNSISKTSYYKEIPSPLVDVTKVYHYSALADRKVFSDRPDIDQLVGNIVMGATDNVMYYINRYDEKLTLRPISETSAVTYGGSNYKDKIIYFDDSIIYSYPIGQPLY